MVVCSALMIWRFLMLATLSESPVVVVLSGSMEPGFRRGDILFLDNRDNRPFRTGDIVVFSIDGRSIPIVHRAIKVHERRNDTSEIFVLTKGDNNWADDVGLYAPGQKWLERKHIMGRVIGYLPGLGEEERKRERERKMFACLLTCGNFDLNPSSCFFNVFIRNR